MPADILDNVLISPDAQRAYLEFAHTIAVNAKLPPNTEIPDERAAALPDGSLLVYVDIPSARIAVRFVIPPAEWAYKDRN
jgi:hypothetical protein